MKRIICLLMAVILLVLLCGCKEDTYSLTKKYTRSENIPVYDFTGGEAAQPEGYDAYISGATEFAFDMLNMVVDEDENVVISPYSAGVALSVLMNGASDNTRNQLRKVLCQGEDTEVINEGNHYLSSRLSAFDDEEGKFTSVNSIWLDDSFDVKPGFLQTTVNYYDADIRRILLGGAEETINKWISDSTDKEITDAVKEIDEATMAIIVNAVLFEDEWATPYEEGGISEGVFYGTKEDVTASYMTSQEVYLETAYAKGFTKGFADLPLKFAALLPEEDTEIGAFVKGLTAARWQSLLDSQKVTVSCEASLPQFEIKEKYSLKEPLEKLGVTDIFDVEKADFAAMTNSDKMYVSAVTQDAFIKINAKGAKAGAVTSIKGNQSAAPSGQKNILKFDRPFVFVIYDNESGIPVFTGIVNTIE